MQQALSLARQGLGKTAPNPAVGCVIVKDGEASSTPSIAEAEVERLACRTGGW